MILHAPIHTLGCCCHPHATHSWPAVPPLIRGQAQRAAHLLVRNPSRQASAASSLLAEQARGTQDSSTVTPARGADKQASPWAQLPGHPRGYRCRLCFETDFSTRGHLAEHLVSIRPVLDDNKAQTHAPMTKLAEQKTLTAAGRLLKLGDSSWVVCRLGGNMQEPGLASSMYAPTAARRIAMQGACESMCGQPACALKTKTLQRTTRATPGSAAMIWTLDTRLSLM